MSSKKPLPLRKTTATVAAAAGASSLLGDIEQLIHEARHSAAVAVNVSLTKLYGSIGKRVRDEVLGFQRAGYGIEIVATPSRQLIGSHDGVGCGDGLRRSARRRQLPRPRPSNASEASA